MTKIGTFSEYGPEYLLTFSRPRNDSADLLTKLKGNTAFTQLTEVGAGKGLRFRSQVNVADMKTILSTETQLQPSDYTLVTGQFFGMPLD